MLRLVAYFIPVALMAWALSWLADRPGSVLINWQGREIEISLFHAMVMLALLVGLTILAWSILVQLWRSPAALGAVFNRRRHVRGLDALSSGMIAIGAGDRAGATRYAVQARRSLPNEPLTHLLRAQAAQLVGDRTTARRIFESMLGAPETEQLGLRGLFLEAEREGEHEAARQFADRAVRLNPKLGWPVDALFELQCKDHDWDAALDTLAIARRNQQVEKSVADRRRAVLLTARAQAIEDSNPDRAMQLALEAHHLAHDLIPAAAIAGRILAARGQTKRAAHVIERTWRRAPHPDLATVYAHARTGDSPHDRLQRVKRLSSLNQHSIETPLAVASAAIEAREWEVARRQLEPLAEDRATQRVCTLMARIESEEHGDAGRVREWLARAVHAPRDAAWTADGKISDHWAPVSPVTGALDAFQWRVPVSALETTDTTLLARKLDELVRLGAKSATIESALEPALPTELPATARTATTTAAAEATPDRKDHKSVADASVEPRLPVIVPPVPADLPAKLPAPEKVTGKVSERVTARSPDRSRDMTIPAIGPVAAVRIEPAGKTTGSRPDGVTAVVNSRLQTGDQNGKSVLETRVFVPPRAPDDPGLEHPGDSAKPRLEDAAREASTRSGPAKRSF